LLRGTIAEISGSFSEQPLSIGVIDIESLGLKVWSIVSPHLRPLVPIQPQPAEAIEDACQGILHLACLIGVLNADDEPAAVVPGEEPVEQGGPEIPYMRVSGRAGGETHPNVWISHNFVLALLPTFADFTGTSVPLLLF
jgi:hypothetical protein